MLRVLSLFSGIGAFEVALDEENIDWELDHYCEIDKYACRSYNCIHGTTDEDNLKDVTNIDYSKIGRVDLVTYGFPCQDISLAGNQKGFFDEEGNLTRSGLFFNAADVIRHTKPKFAIFENVKNLTGKKFKAEFETVLSVLDELGYNTYWKVLNAKDYGIPQNRERVFGISIRKDIDHGYEFPLPVELTLRLKDMLEEQVEEKYYLSEQCLKGFLKHNENHEAKGTGFKWKPRELNGIASCLRANSALAPTQGGHRQPKILVKEATKKGYAEAEIGDSINLEQPNSKTRRGRVGKGVAQTLTTSCNQAVVEPNFDEMLKGTNYARNFGSKGKVQMEDGVCSTLQAAMGSGGGNIPLTYTQFRIRKLTPRECWRLMGFKDKYFDRVQGVSNSQLYKQAGNSIVVDVLRAIFRELKKQYPDDFKEVWGEDL